MSTVETTLLTAIGSYGFPIVVAVFLLWTGKSEHEQHLRDCRVVLERLEIIISGNTTAMTALTLSQTTSMASLKDAIERLCEQVSKR